MPPQQPTPPKPRAPPGTAQARRPPRVTTCPRPVMRPARHPAGARGGGRGAARRAGPGWRRCPRDARKGPRTPHPPSCPRAGPEGLTAPRAAFISTAPPDLARVRAALRAARGARKVPEQRCAEKQDGANHLRELVGNFSADGHRP